MFFFSHTSNQRDEMYVEIPVPRRGLDSTLSCRLLLLVVVITVLASEVRRKSRLVDASTVDTTFTPSQAGRGQNDRKNLLHAFVFHNAIRDFA
jgi:hypothetical protein